MALADAAMPVRTDTAISAETMVFMAASPFGATWRTPCPPHRWRNHRAAAEASLSLRRQVLKFARLTEDDPRAAATPASRTLPRTLVRRLAGARASRPRIRVRPRPCARHARSRVRCDDRALR